MKLLDHRAVARLAARSLAAGVAFIALTTAAHAQQVQPGATTPLMNLFVRGVDTAAGADGSHLVVGGQGPLYAACLNAQGAAITGPMLINATPGGYGSFPRATYSQQLFGGAGGYMIVWAEAVGSSDAMRQLFARPISCSGAAGAPQVVSPTTWWEPGDMAISYSSTSQVFLVAWQTPEHTVKASLANLAGAPVGPTMLLSPGMGRDPSVTWNWTTDQFGVAFSGETYSAFVIVPPSNPAAFQRNTFNVAGGILTTMTDVAYNGYTGRYVMSWFELSSGSFAKVAEFDASGKLMSMGVASSRLGSYDAFSMGLNLRTGTFLMVGVDRNLDTVLGLELNYRGFPFNGENTLSGTRPSRYPRVSSSAVAPTWDVAFSGPNFGALSSVIATSFAGAGGPPGEFPAPGAPAPPPSQPPPTLGPPPAPTCPGTVPVPGWQCYNGNWLPPDSPLLPKAAPPPPPPPPPPVSHPVVSDFTGDRRSDIVLYRPTSGKWYLLQSGTGFTGGSEYSWGGDGDVPATGDYDGDGKMDVTVYRPSTGHWFILKSSSGYLTWVIYQWGMPGDIPVPGDYDGDGKTDPAVFRPSTATWYILLSGSGFTAGAGFVWGSVNGDIPVVGDFDGDGRADITVFRPSTGLWGVRQSSTNYTTSALYQLGLPGDIPAVADYDGDGKSDIAIYRPSNGIWDILRSNSGFTSGWEYQWGAGADMPVIGDFDGDGRADLTVYRPSTAQWFILRSGSNYAGWAVYQFGNLGDMPIVAR
jgi:hypothetical protein